MSARSRSHGRTTRRFRRLRSETLDESTICIVCGHDGADSADHIIALSVDPELAEDADNLGPCHHRPCPVCGRQCNNEKGTRPLADVVHLRTSEDWFTDEG
jgi:5-methylcytosine-specific restriction endonuclease McrA